MSNKVHRRAAYSLLPSCAPRGYESGQRQWDLASNQLSSMSSSSLLCFTMFFRTLIPLAILAASVFAAVLDKRAVTCDHPLAALPRPMQRRPPPSLAARETQISAKAIMAATSVRLWPRCWFVPSPSY